MAGTLKTSQFNSATVANPTDEVPLLQGGQLKRVQVKVLTGNPDTGWQASGESWVFSSFNSTTRIGVVTVPSDATTKYVAGMWVRISQATGGTKWGVIRAVTATTLSINFFYNQTLTNEAITTPFYSPLRQPVGSPALPVKSTDANGWTVLDFGTYREWTKYFTRGVSQAGSAWTNATGENLPVGLSTMGTNILTTSVQSGDAAITANIGSSTGVAQVQIQHTNQFGSTVTTTLYIYARIMEV